MLPKRIRRLRQPARLFIVGAAALYWELLLIRWFSSWIRIVAYYTNFVLIAAFFGLGLGALLSRYRVRLWRMLGPLLGLCLAAGLGLSHFSHANPGIESEFVWLGGPAGIRLPEVFGARMFSLPLLLTVLYSLVSSVFVCFGQWLGRLFAGLAPLKAYSLQMAGSIFGILFFAVFSFFQLSPLVWIAGGYLLLLAAGQASRADRAVLLGSAAIILALAAAPVSDYRWSPYYKIKVDPITEIQDMDGPRSLRFSEPVGYQVAVNSDYHQMLLDLRARKNEHPFFTSWRQLYEAPYLLDAALPEGPVLVIGAGTGNDVMAALRITRRRVYAVDIDPAIVEIGRRLHPERPYEDPRVTLVVDDARSFMQKTPVKFALVVFGFLDSHTLFSAFSSLRLDNFVYTRESFQRVKEIMLPGAEVSVTFASHKPWIHQRLIAMLDDVFDGRTQFLLARPPAYANGIVYRNFKRPIPSGIQFAPPRDPRLKLPTDNWPFLYLERPQVPRQYFPFLVIVVLMGAASLLALPAGRRQVNLPYFFMGAAFFLLETRSVVSLSLLYGSTWVVNAVVFLGILALALAGTLLAAGRRQLPLVPLCLALLASLALIYRVPVSALLPFHSALLRGTAACVIFLGPVFFAALIFARLLRLEEDLVLAYGSNLLGAVIGGACEYQSLRFGFHYLLNLILLLYLLSFWFVYRSRKILLQP